MTDQTKIEWCDSTFNPWTGCAKISPACDHCYAESWSKRAGAKVGKWGPGAPRVRTSAANWRQPIKWNARPFFECAACGWRGDESARGRMPYDHDTDAAPLKGCPSCHAYEFKPARRRVFCASLADVFDNEVDPQWRVDLLELIAKTPNLDWLLLTKRIGNAERMLDEAIGEMSHGLTRWKDAPWPNVWLGITICNQDEADRDVPKLLKTPAAVRFLSIEPMLGPIDLRRCVIKKAEFPERGQPPVSINALHGWWGGADAGGRTRVDWVIPGGESGPHARPMHPYWVRSLLDQCKAAGVPFLFKQWGEWRPISEGKGDWYSHLYRPNVVAKEGENQGHLNESFGQRCIVETSVIHTDGSFCDRLAPGAWEQGTGAMLTFKVGKKAAGRSLDGVEHNAFPQVQPCPT